MIIGAMTALRCMGPSRVALAALAVLAGPLAVGQEAAPPAPESVATAEATLAARGLKRVGNLYLLESEIAAKQQLAQDEAAVAQLRAEAAAVQSAGQLASGTLADLNRQLGRLEFQLNDLIVYAGRLAASNDPAAQSQLIGVRAQIQEGQNAVNQVSQSRSLIESEQRQRSQKLNELQNAVAAREADAARRVAGLAASYAAMATDREVSRALKELNRTARPWVMIGPEAHYGRNVGLFAQAVLAESGLRRDRRGQLHLAGEAEVRELGHRAWLLSQELDGPEGAASRRELAEVVSRLRLKADEVGRSYERLAVDPLVVAAIGYLAGPSRRPHRLAPSAEFAKEVARIPEFERALGGDRTATGRG